MSDVLVLAEFAFVMALMLLVAWQVGALGTNASSSHYNTEIDTVGDLTRELGAQTIMTEAQTD